MTSPELSPGRDGMIKPMDRMEYVRWEQGMQGHRDERRRWLYTLVKKLVSLILRMWKYGVVCLLVLASLPFLSPVVFLSFFGFVFLAPLLCGATACYFLLHRFSPLSLINWYGSPNAPRTLGAQPAEFQVPEENYVVDDAGIREREALLKSSLQGTEEEREPDARSVYLSADEVSDTDAGLGDDNEVQEVPELNRRFQDSQHEFDEVSRELTSQPDNVSTEAEEQALVDTEVEEENVSPMKEPLAKTPFLNEEVEAPEPVPEEEEVAAPQAVKENPMEKTSSEAASLSELPIVPDRAMAEFELEESKATPLEDAVLEVPTEEEEVNKASKVEEELPQLVEGTPFEELALDPKALELGVKEKKVTPVEEAVAETPLIEEREVEIPVPAAQEEEVAAPEPVDENLNDEEPVETWLEQEVPVMQEMVLPEPALEEKKAASLEEATLMIPTKEKQEVEGPLLVPEVEVKEKQQLVENTPCEESATEPEQHFMEEKTLVEDRMEEEKVTPMEKPRVEDLLVERREDEGPVEEVEEVAALNDAPKEEAPMEEALEPELAVMQERAFLKPEFENKGLPLDKAALEIPTEEEWEVYTPLIIPKMEDKELPHLVETTPNEGSTLVPQASTGEGKTFPEPELKEKVSPMEELMEEPPIEPALGLTAPVTQERNLLGLDNSDAVEEVVPQLVDTAIEDPELDSGTSTTEMESQEPKVEEERATPLEDPMEEPVADRSLVEMDVEPGVPTTEQEVVTTLQATGETQKQKPAVEAAMIPALLGVQGRALPELKLEEEKAIPMEETIPTTLTEEEAILEAKETPVEEPALEFVPPLAEKALQELELQDEKRALPEPALEDEKATPVEGTNPETSTEEEALLEAKETPIEELTLEPMAHVVEKALQEPELEDEKRVLPELELEDEKATPVEETISETLTEEEALLEAKETPVEELVLESVALPVEKALQEPKLEDENRALPELELEDEKATPVEETIPESSVEEALLKETPVEEPTLVPPLAAKALQEPELEAEERASPEPALEDEKATHVQETILETLTGEEALLEAKETLVEELALEPVPPAGEKAVQKLELEDEKRALLEPELEDEKAASMEETIREALTKEEALLEAKETLVDEPAMEPMVSVVEKEFQEPELEGEKRALPKSALEDEKDTHVEETILEASTKEALLEAKETPIEEPAMEPMAHVKEMSLQEPKLENEKRALLEHELEDEKVTPMEETISEALAEKEALSEAKETPVEELAVEAKVSIVEKALQEPEMEHEKRALPKSALEDEKASPVEETIPEASTEEEALLEAKGTPIVQPTMEPMAPVVEKVLQEPELEDEKTALLELELEDKKATPMAETIPKASTEEAVSEAKETPVEEPTLERVQSLVEEALQEPEMEDEKGTFPEPALEAEKATLVEEIVPKALTKEEALLEAKETPIGESVVEPMVSVVEKALQEPEMEDEKRALPESALEDEKATPMEIVPETLIEEALSEAKETPGEEMIVEPIVSVVEKTLQEPQLEDEKRALPEPTLEAEKATLVEEIILEASIEEEALLEAKESLVEEPTMQPTAPMVEKALQEPEPKLEDENRALLEPELEDQKATPMETIPKASIDEEALLEAKETPVEELAVEPMVSVVEKALQEPELEDEKAALPESTLEDEKATLVEETILEASIEEEALLETKETPIEELEMEPMAPMKENSLQEPELEDEKRALLELDSEDKKATPREEIIPKASTKEEALSEAKETPIEELAVEPMVFVVEKALQEPELKDENQALPEHESEDDKATPMEETIPGTSTKEEALLEDKETPVEELALEHVPHAVEKALQAPEWENVRRALPEPESEEEKATPVVEATYDSLIAEEREVEVGVLNPELDDASVEEEKGKAPLVKLEPEEKTPLEVGNDLVEEPTLEPEAPMVKHKALPEPNVDDEEDLIPMEDFGAKTSSLEEKEVQALVPTIEDKELATREEVEETPLERSSIEATFDPASHDVQERALLVPDLEEEKATLEGEATLQTLTQEDEEVEKPLPKLQTEEKETPSGVQDDPTEELALKPEAFMVEEKEIPETDEQEERLKLLEEPIVGTSFTKKEIEAPKPTREEEEEVAAHEAVEEMPQKKRSIVAALEPAVHNVQERTSLEPELEEEKATSNEEVTTETFTKEEVEKSLPEPPVEVCDTLIEEPAWKSKPLMMEKKELPEGEVNKEVLKPMEDPVVGTSSTEKETEAPVSATEEDVPAIEAMQETPEEKPSIEATLEHSVHDVQERDLLKPELEEDKATSEEEAIPKTMTKEEDHERALPEPELEKKAIYVEDFSDGLAEQEEGVEASSEVEKVGGEYEEEASYGDPVLDNEAPVQLENVLAKPSKESDDLLSSSEGFQELSSASKGSNEWTSASITTQLKSSELPQGHSTAGVEELQTAGTLGTTQHEMDEDDEESGSFLKFAHLKLHQRRLSFSEAVDNLSRESISEKMSNIAQIEEQDTAQASTVSSDMQSKDQIPASKREFTDDWQIQRKTWEEESKPGRLPTALAFEVSCLEPQSAGSPDLPSLEPQSMGSPVFEFSTPSAPRQKSGIGGKNSTLKFSPNQRERVERHSAPEILRTQTWAADSGDKKFQDMKKAKYRGWSEADGPVMLLQSPARSYSASCTNSTEPHSGEFEGLLQYWRQRDKAARPPASAQKDSPTSVSPADVALKIREEINTIQRIVGEDIPSQHSLWKDVESLSEVVGMELPYMGDISDLAKAKHGLDLLKVVVGIK